MPVVATCIWATVGTGNTRKHENTIPYLVKLPYYRVLIVSDLIEA
jgi:hypothetical protein